MVKEAMLWGFAPPAPKYRPVPLTGHLIPFTANDFMERKRRRERNRQIDEEEYELTDEDEHSEGDEEWESQRHRRSAGGRGIHLHEREMQSEYISDILAGSGAGQNLIGGLISQLSKGAENEQEFMEIENRVEADLFDIDHRLSDRLYGWMPWGWSEYCKTHCCISCLGVIVLIVLYSLGLGGFVLLNQRILACDQGLLAPSMNASCAGLAENCKIANNFTSIKLYVQFRIMAFIMLLIPFVYIPFMTILDISMTAKKVWETLGLKRKDPKHESRSDQFQKKIKQEREDTFVEFGGKRNFIFEATAQTVLHLSPSGHEKLLLTLFIICHIFLGGFSITLDVFAMQLGQEARCQALKDSLGLMGQGDIGLNIQGVATYNFILGIVFFLLTFIYVFFQWGNTLQKQAYRRQKKRENLMKEQARISKIRTSQRELHNLKASHQREFNRMAEEEENRKFESARKAELEKFQQEQAQRLREASAPRLERGQRNYRERRSRRSRYDANEEDEEEEENG